jgi:hypothetical protein
MDLLALAFADNTFKKKGAQRLEDLYSFEIPHFKELLSIQWKPEIRETPVFRRFKGVDDPFTFTNFGYYLKRLGPDQNNILSL